MSRGWFLFVEVVLILGILLGAASIGIFLSTSLTSCPLWLSGGKIFALNLEFALYFLVLFIAFLCMLAFSWSAFQRHEDRYLRKLPVRLLSFLLIIASLSTIFFLLVQLAFPPAQITC
jgi:uncharacterized membrane protein